MKSFDGLLLYIRDYIQKFAGLVTVPFHSLTLTMFALDEYFPIHAVNTDTNARLGVVNAATAIIGQVRIYEIMFLSIYAAFRFVHS